MDDIENFDEKMALQMLLKAKSLGHDINPEDVVTFMTKVKDKYSDQLGDMPAAVNVLKAPEGQPLSDEELYKRFEQTGEALGIYPSSVHGENNVLDAATKAKSRYKEIMDRLRTQQ